MDEKKMTEEQQEKVDGGRVVSAPDLADDLADPEENRFNPCTGTRRVNRPDCGKFRGVFQPVE